MAFFALRRRGCLSPSVARISGKFSVTEAKNCIYIFYNNISRPFARRYYHSVVALMSPRGMRTDEKLDETQHFQSRDLEQLAEPPRAGTEALQTEFSHSIDSRQKGQNVLSEEKQLAEGTPDSGNPLPALNTKSSPGHALPYKWTVLANELGLPEKIKQLWKDKYTLLPSRCGGCGTPLQFKNPERLGFVSIAKLESLAHFKRDNIKRLVCQNCFSLKHYGQLLVKSFNKDLVLDQFKGLPRSKALIVYLVDMLNIEGSMFPDLLNLVGESKRVLVVGNKIDMLPCIGSPGSQQNHMKKVLREICMNNGLDNANIKDICLVSGKTGHGIREFLTSVIKHRDLSMDICLVGCTNVGKSTIFNLLQNFIGVYHKSTLPAQATIHHVPGTTIGLLRYPVGYWNLYSLRRRLLPKRDGVDTGDDKFEESMKDYEYEFDSEIMKDLMPEERYKGDLIKSYMQTEQDTEGEEDTFEPANKLQPLQVEFIEQDPKAKKQCWLYDTPGLINEGQIIHFLKPKEIKFLQQNLWIVPRTLILKPGQSLLFGGLAKLDFNDISKVLGENSDETGEVLKANQSVYFTVFCAKMLPLHVTSILKANDVYESHFGKELLQIPFGEPERREEFPPLEAKEHEVVGIGWQESAADLVLAGVGWVAVTAGYQSRVHLSFHTPLGLGQYLRETPLMPFSVRQRGKRGVRYQGTMNKAIYEGTRRRSPQLVSFLKKGNEPVFEMIKKVKEKEKMERAAIMEEKMKRNFLEGKSKLHRLGLVDKRQNDGQQGPFIEAEGQQELFIEDGSEEK